MKVGDKVWVYFGGFWEKAVVVPKPEHMEEKRGRVFVQFDDHPEVHRYNKEWVRENTEYMNRHKEGSE